MTCLIRGERIQKRNRERVGDVYSSSHTDVLACMRPLSFPCKALGPRLPYRTWS